MLLFLFPITQFILSRVEGSGRKAPCCWEEALGSLDGGRTAPPFSKGLFLWLLGSRACLWWKWRASALPRAQPMDCRGGWLHRWRHGSEGEPLHASLHQTPGSIAWCWLYGVPGTWSACHPMGSVLGAYRITYSAGVTWCLQAVCFLGQEPETQRDPGTTDTGYSPHFSEARRRCRWEHRQGTRHMQVLAGGGGTGQVMEQ